MYDHRSRWPAREVRGERPSARGVSAVAQDEQNIVVTCPSAAKNGIVLRSGALSIQRMDWYGRLFATPACCQSARRQEASRAFPLPLV